MKWQAKRCVLVKKTGKNFATMTRRIVIMHHKKNTTQNTTTRNMKAKKKGEDKIKLFKKITPEEMEQRPLFCPKCLSF